MKYTGERHIDTESGGLISATEHTQRYWSLVNIVDGKVVLDCACGSGHGTLILSEKAKKVYGVDISEEAIEHCKENNNKDNIEYIVGSIEKLPLEDNSVDVVVSLETIEHVDETLQRKFMKEIKRVLAPKGLAYISTPNKKFFDNLKNYSNPYHIKEFYIEEFQEFLNEYFEYIDISYQFYGLSSNITNLDSNAQLENFDFIKEKCKYILCACSDSSIDARINHVLNSMCVDAPLFNINKEIYKLENDKGVVYIDTGDGYSEKNKQYSHYYTSGNLHNIEFSLAAYNNIRSIRFDPIKGEFIKINLCDITASYSDGRNIELGIKNTNGTYYDDEFIEFLILDGYIELQGEFTDISSLKITCEIETISSSEIEKKLSSLKNDVTEKEKVINEQMQVLSSHENDVKQKISIIEIQQNNIDELGTKISQISESLSHQKSENERLHLHNKELSNTAISLKNSNEELNDSLALTNHKLRNEQNAHVSLIEAYKDLETAYLNIINSKIYRITKPLRKFSGFLKKVKNFRFTTVRKGINYLKNYGIKRFSAKTFDYLFRRKKNEDDTAVALPAEVKIDVNKKNVFVSVVIPTFNAGDEFELLLKDLISQKLIGRIEIVVVDSGSTDNTVEICKKYNVNLVEIPNEDFSHSYSRNLGASHAKGDYLLFMTQDVSVTEDVWVSQIISILKENDVVALSCDEIVRDDADLFARVKNFEHNNYIFSGAIDKINSMPESRDENAVRKAAQLTDVNCLVRKNVFLDYKYEGDYAEDLLLGKKLLEDGYKIAQVSSVKVMHSHTRNGFYELRRSIVEHRSLFKMLNIKKKLADYNSAISSIVNSYNKILFIIENTIRVFEGSNLERLTSLINKNYKTIKLKDCRNIFSNIEDKNVGELICKLRNLNINYNNEDYITGSIIEFYNNQVSNYLIKNQVVLSKEVLDDISSAMYKHLCIIIGAELYKSSLSINKNEQINDVISGLVGGI